MTCTPAAKTCVLRMPVAFPVFVAVEPQLEGGGQVIMLWSVARSSN
jgi:hypothetical protein